MCCRDSCDRREQQVRPSKQQNVLAALRSVEAVSEQFACLRCWVSARKDPRLVLVASLANGERKGDIPGVGGVEGADVKHAHP